MTAAERADGPVTGVRVLHVSQPVTEGVATWVTSLVADQVSRGWDVSVACPPDSSLAASVARCGARHLAWQAGRSPGPSTAREVLALRRLLRGGPVDVVHLHSSKAALAGRVVLRGAVPTLVQPHGWSFAAAGRVAPLVRRWEVAAARWTSAVVCVSEGERRQAVAAGLPPALLSVVPNGVDPGTWPAAGPGERAAARRRLGLADHPTVVCVGRLCEQKGQDRLLAAWPAVVPAVPGAQLVLVGDGPAAQPLRQQAGRLPEPAADVRFAGRRTDVRDWFAAADVVVVPSRWEGLALVALEAAASARSVVATDVPGTSEVLGSVSTAVVAQDAPDLTARLAAAVVQRLRDPATADAEGAALRERVLRQSSLAAATEATARLTSGLVGAGGPAPARVGAP